MTCNGEILLRDMSWVGRTCRAVEVYLDEVEKTSQVKDNAKLDLGRLIGVDLACELAMPEDGAKVGVAAYARYAYTLYTLCTQHEKWSRTMLDRGRVVLGLLNNDEADPCQCVLVRSRRKSFVGSELLRFSATVESKNGGRYAYAPVASILASHD